MHKKKVSVIGLGYVGLPTYVAIHQTNTFDVVGYTRNQKRIDSLYQGHSQIDEPSIDAYLQKNKDSLHFTNSDTDLHDSFIFLICVPTPVFDDYTPDYGPIISATKRIAPLVTKGCHIVLESTVNPGTTREILIPIIEEVSGLTAEQDFNIAHCPERVNPGDKQWNIFNINRNIGSINATYNKEIADFYREILPEAAINEVSSLEIAEATKIVENSFRDINIAFVNELAQSFDTMKINVKETIDAASNKPFGFMAHYPGAGVGGHCIAVDPYYLIKKAATLGFDHKFLKLAREINNGMPEYVVYKTMLALNQVKLPMNGTKVAVLGLSYKPDIGDIRNSPSFEILQGLQKHQCDLSWYDPHVENESLSAWLQSIQAPTMDAALNGAQAVVVLTAHSYFVENLYDHLTKHDTAQVVIDGRNCLPIEQFQERFVYSGVGTGL